MVKLLPVAALIAFLSLFGLSWIIVVVDPTAAPWFIFASFVFLVFSFSFSFLSLVLYFVRTRFYKRYSASWYVKTSFKMSLFISIFIAICAALAILKQVTVINIGLGIVAVVLFAVWSYLGKREG
ncbi:MAG: hypothetical protein NUV69_03095 [Candidatus Curtissbacteria bacterium]|nr:hypothetical protein [Candidatus Curtissbacteria bacterium]